MAVVVVVGPVTTVGFVGVVTTVVVAEGELLMKPGALFARLLKAGEVGGVAAILPGPIGFDECWPTE